MGENARNLRRYAGRRRGSAMRYILTSEEWGAAEEYRLGLVQELTPPGKQLDRALEFADTIATNAPLGARFGASGDQWRRPRPGCTVASLRADSAERGRQGGAARGAGTPPPRIPRTVKPQQRANLKAEGHADDQPSRESGSWARYCGVRFEWMGERSTCSNISDAPDPRDVGYGSGRDCGR